MDVPFSRWHAAVPLRRSRRRFDATELEPGQQSQMETLCRDFRPFPEARAQLLTHSTDRVFKGVIGNYGKIKGATALVAFIGDMADQHIQEKVGYMGEGIILEATAMGLATCWVGGFFRREVTESILGTRARERVLAVTPVGNAVQEVSLEERTMTGFGRTHTRRELSDLAGGLDQSEWPQWVRSALEAARIAPSAVNRQPWRFRVEPESITVSVDSPRFNVGVSKRLDCGIAMLHIEVAALDSGVRGGWEFLDSPQVARFTLVGD